MTVGERIKVKRILAGLTQEELAHKLGYKNKSSINKIEQGKENLTQTKIKAIADALSTTPAYIMGWDEELIISEERQQIDDILNAHKNDEDFYKHLLEYAKFLISQKEK